MPSAHVHAIARDPGSGKLVVAAHDGLYVYDGTTPERVGPVIDLMGFTVAGPGHYYASGHPGTATDLPQPVGLIESRDGGKTWKVLSRGGRSDFHALTTTGQTVVGFDGAVRATTDGRTWTDGNLDAQPRTLAGSREGPTVLATTEEGLMRSTDGGATWQQMDQASWLLMAAFGDGDTVAGLTPDGQVHTSADAGRTWRATDLLAPRRAGAVRLGRGRVAGGPRRRRPAQSLSPPEASPSNPCVESVSGGGRSWEAQGGAAGRRGPIVRRPSRRAILFCR